MLAIEDTKLNKKGIEVKAMNVCFSYLQQTFIEQLLCIAIFFYMQF